MTALEAFLDTTDETPAELVAVLANIAAVTDVLDEHKDAVRDRLETKVRALAEMAGGQFTGRFDAGMAYLSGGNPKPTVRDRDALASWLADEEPDLIAWRDTVEVVDHQEAAAIINYCSTASVRTDEGTREVLDALFNLAEHCLRVVRVPLWDGEILDVLLARGYQIAGDVIVHEATGQPLPGVEVVYTRETLTVKPSKDVRSQVAARLREQLCALPVGGAA